MLNHFHQFSGRVVRNMLVGGLAALLMGFGLLGNSAPVWAATKAPLSETMEATMTKAAQEFVETIMDDYSDSIEGSFKTALKPIKSSIKDLTKQLSKAAASPTAASEAALAPKLTASQTALETAAAAFATLMTDTDAIKASLADAPKLLEDAIQVQLGAKFDELDAALSGVSDAVALLTEDTTTFSAEDPTASTAAFTEHATLLTQAIEAASTVLDSFDS